jgi:hypothetical protein
MLTSVLKRTKELWGKVAESAKSWGKSDKETNAADRKKFLPTCDAVMRVEQWSVNKAVHYNAWANFEVNDFQACGCRVQGADGMQSAKPVHNCRFKPRWKGAR